MDKDNETKLAPKNAEPKKVEPKKVEKVESKAVVPEKVEAPKRLMVDEVVEDYLQQYQYKKQAEFGSKQTNPALGSKSADMKANLLKQDKVRIFIPRQNQEDPGIKLPVTLNGYRLDLPKQVYIEVPMQVAEVIMDSLQQTEQALLQNQIGLRKDKESALL